MAAKEGQGRFTTNRGRTYLWRDEQFTSVTTIIGGGVPKPALKAWGERLVAETAVAKIGTWNKMSTDEAVDWLKRAPFRETDRAAIQGSDIHHWAEQYILGHPVCVTDAPEDQRGYLDGFLRFMAEMRPHFEMAEASVYNRTHGYAGTLDALVRVPLLGDGLGLVDYKTGKGVYGETALQLSAYRHAEFIGLPNGQEVPMPPVAWCAVLHLTRDGYELIPVEAGPIVFEYFLHAQMVRDFCEDVSRTVLAPPVSLPEPPALFTPPPNIAALVD